jgi:hypothetical protein
MQRVCASVVSCPAAASLTIPTHVPCVLLQVALKCADLGHLAEELAVHKRWVRCLEEEFFLQGDREKAGGLPISPLFDRDKPGVTKSQVTKALAHQTAKES